MHILTQLTSQSSTLVDDPDALDSPPQSFQEDASDTDHIASVGNLPGESLIDANANILGVYQDWVHQNHGTHLDGRIEDDDDLTAVSSLQVTMRYVMISSTSQNNIYTLTAYSANY